MDEKMKLKDVLDYLGMQQNTFKKYADNLGIHGENVGRCTMYYRSDIERMNKMLCNRVPALIQLLEKLTGCKVKLTENVKEY